MVIFCSASLGERQKRGGNSVRLSTADRFFGRRHAFEPSVDVDEGGDEEEVGGDPRRGIAEADGDVAQGGTAHRLTAVRAIISETPDSIARFV